MFKYILILLTVTPLLANGASTRTDRLKNKKQPVTSATQKTKGKMPKWSKIREALKGTSFTAFYSFASDLASKSDSGEATFIGENAFGFGVEYKLSNLTQIQKKYPVGIVGGLTYDTTRSSDKVKLNSGVGKLDKAIKINFWTLYANGVVDFDDKFSAFGGINYSLPNVSGVEESVKSAVGFQMGASYAFNEQFAVDGIYRWINFEIKDTDSNRMDGFLVRGRYIF